MVHPSKRVTDHALLIFTGPYSQHLPRVKKILFSEKNTYEL